MIRITDEQADRVHRTLGGIKNGSEKAFKSIINRTLDTIETESVRQIQEVYIIKAATLKNKNTTKVGFKRATYGNLAGEIKFAGYKVPLYKYDVSPKKPNRGIISTRKLKSSSRKEFRNAFIASMTQSSGHTGIFERTTKNHYPIIEIMGDSFAEMAGSSLVMEKIEEKAEETIDKRIDVEINRILNGYGG